MQKKYSIVFIALALLLGEVTFSQNNTSSPYTQFGIGDLTNKSFGSSNAMGGIGYGLRSSEHVNIKNPASYSSIDSMSFIFTFGLKSKVTQYKTIDDKLTKNNSNLSYLAISFPVTKWLKSSIGLLPYSNVGYGFLDTIYYENIGSTLNYNYGSGGINQFYLGNSIELFDQVSVGFNVSYLFGSLQQIRTLLFVDEVGFLNTQREDIIRVNDLYLSYGLQYYNKLNDKFSYVLGVSLENSSKINSSYESITISTSSELVEEVDPYYIFDTTQYIYEENNSIILPSNLGLGFSVNYDEKLTFGVDYNIQNWSESRILGKTDSLVNSNSFQFGLEYIPDKNSATKYYKRFNYRLGGHITNSYIQLYDEQLKDIGFSFGIGIPIKRTRSVVNLSFDFGKRGTTDHNLILENYGILSLNVSLSDIWFIKRKFD